MPKNGKGKTTQTERAYLSLKGAILRGEIEEGSFLSEAEITARYRVGRTPYREACNRLHHEKLLQVVPHHGYLVPEISFQTVCDLFEIRLILEDAVAQLATARATERDIKELEDLVNEGFSSKKAEASISEFIETNTRFHMALARASKNKRLVDLIKQTLENTERLMYIEMRSSGRSATDFRSDHEPILEAIKRRDADAVQKAVWADIRDAQSLTVNLGKRVHTALVAGYANGLPAAQSVSIRRGHRKGQADSKDQPN